MSELKSCEGCGQKPVNAAPSQSNGFKFQCPYYAAHDRENIKDGCWGMLGSQSYESAVECWNGGKSAYFKRIGN